jgi:four helix bundle protein
VRCFRDLIVWQKAMMLAETIYSVTGRLPKEELFGLARQMRRAAVSVASNIAEGQARRSRKEFLQFLSHARGSLAELETQIILATRLAYVTTDTEASLISAIDEVGRLLNGLRNSLKASQPTSP